MLTKNDLVAIKNIVSEEVRKEIAAETNPINKKLRKLNKDLNAVITLFDDDIIDTKCRVDRIENHLHLSPIQIN